MNLEEFNKSIQTLEKCPASLPLSLQGLWYDKKYGWDEAHEFIGDASDKDTAWVHAYLHRREGDLNNARYWYNSSGHVASLRIQNSKFKIQNLNPHK